MPPKLKLLSGRDDSVVRIQERLKVENVDKLLSQGVSSVESPLFGKEWQLQIQARRDTEGDAALDVIFNVQKASNHTKQHADPISLTIYGWRQKTGIEHTRYFTRSATFLNPLPGSQLEIKDILTRKKHWDKYEALCEEDCFVLVVYVDACPGPSPSSAHVLDILHRTMPNGAVFVQPIHFVTFTTRTRSGCLQGRRIMYSDDQQLVPWLKLSNFRSEELKPGGNSQEEQCCTPRACVLDEDSDLEEGPDEELEYVQAEESKAHQATSKQEITRTNAREYVTVIAASRTWEALLHYTLTGLV